MKFIKYSDAQINVANGKVRNDDVWIDVEEYIRDSGRRKGIKMMNMEVTLIKDKLLYLHFKGDIPTAQGIFLGAIYDDDIEA